MEKVYIKEYQYGVPINVFLNFDFPAVWADTPKSTILQIVAIKN